MKSELKTTLMIACLFVTFAIFGTVFNLSNGVGLTGNVISNPKSSEIREISILESQLGYDNRGDLAVSGVIQNIAGKELSYVEIKIKFYDKDNLLLETSSESINDLGIDEKWKFSSVYPKFNVEEVKSYEVSVGEIW